MIPTSVFLLYKKKLETFLKSVNLLRWPINAPIDPKLAFVRHAHYQQLRIIDGHRTLKTKLYTFGCCLPYTFYFDRIPARVKSFGFTTNN